MSKLGSLYIQLGEPEGELSGCTCEVGDWAADEIVRLRNVLDQLARLGNVHEHGNSIVFAEIPKCT